MIFRPLIGRELLSITVQTIETAVDFDLVSLIESSGSETESLRIADFRPVSSLRKETSVLSHFVIIVALCNNRRTL